jgi:hypothetical protein
MAWSGTPIAATSSVPLMNAAGSGAVNTAANYRQGFIGAFAAPAPGGPMSWRSGVFPTTWDATLNGGAGAHRDLFGIPTTPTNNNHVQVYGGDCVVTRTGSTAGPYLVGFNAVTDLPFDSADPSNPRIDVAAVRLIDTAIDGAGALQGGYMYVINGTASGSPVVPTIPADYTPLFKVLRPANDSVIGSGHGTITDMRKSTGVIGGTRTLLAGDLSTDPGSYIGETTYDAVTSKLSGWRYWGTDAAWHGIGTRTFSQPTAASDLIHMGYTATLNVGTISIPDPGFAYKIEATGQCSIRCNAVNPTSAAGVDAYILIGGTIYANTRVPLTSGSPNNCVTEVSLVSSPVMSGAQTVVFQILNPNGGVYIDANPSAWYQFRLNIIPV